MHKLFASFAQGNTRFGSVNFLKAYTMKRKGRLCNEVDLVTSVLQKVTLLSIDQKWISSADTLYVEKVTTP